MKRVKVSICILIIIFNLISCKPINLKKNDTKINDLNALSISSEKFILSDINYKFNSKGVDINYKDLTGLIDVFNVYSLTKENNVNIKYKSSVSSGSVKVLLVTQNDKVVELFKDAKEGSISTPIYGNTLIRCIGENFTGNIKIDVLFDEQTMKNKADDETTKNNEQVSEINVNNYAQYNGHWGSKDGLNGLSIKFISNDTAIVNLGSISDKKATHIANTEDFKVKFTDNGEGSFSFKEDGWGSSGKGVIRLFKDKIEVEVKIKQNQEYGSLYCVFGGKQKIIFENHQSKEFKPSINN
ncbi:MAG: hypothetical protein N2Z71_06965 [Caloramator sp.]|nr:hypothetical protein [Caloramator sp.]